MKTKNILVAILFLMTGMSGFGQSGLVGFVHTEADQNSIVRSWNDRLILYSEDDAGQGYFSLVEHLTLGTSLDTFMLALTSETGSNYQKEFDKMYVNSSGYVTYSCHTDVVQPIPGTHDHNLFDVAFDGPSGTLAVVNNCNMSQTAVADVYTPISICGPSGKELSHNSIFPNSISKMPSSRLAISGMASQGLGLSVHPILGGGSCMRTTTIPTSTGHKRGMTNHEPCHIIPGSVEKASWIPDITITTFQTICEKD